MKKSYMFLLFFCTSICFSQTKEDVRNIISTYDIALIKQKKQELMTNQRLKKQKAIEKAKALGIPLTINKANGNVDELMDFTPDGSPLYFSSDNFGAARSTRANQLYSGASLGLNLQGQGMTARVWDGGKVRLSHNLLTGRVVSVDDAAGTAFSDHATHVTGTMVASNAVTNTRGMAFQANARTFNWTDDESEALDEVLEGMLISNHSYGIPMINQTTGMQQPEWYIGTYTDSARAWDEITYLSPYYLPVMSAGNNGSDFNSGATTSGYDKLTGDKVAKNSLIVANAQDAIVNTAGNLTAALVINAGSSQGPTDDNRIKPDITGNGTSVLSCTAGSDSATASYDGTSMSSPNVAGTLLLLQQHSKNLTNNFMKSATLKGLATHTADEAGRPGPDAIFGWGLLNAKNAAVAMNNNGLTSWISEEVLNQGQTFTMTVNSDGVTPLIASATWTDLPGPVNNNVVLVNNPMIELINDLDVRITRAGVTSYPWRLQSNATLNATRNSDNNVDNIENVKIDAPTAGLYTITVTHKGNLVSGKQPFSLVITGVTSTFSISSTSSDVVGCNNQDAVYTFSYKQTGTLTTTFSAVGLPVGASASFSPATLNANGTVTMTVSGLNSVAAGNYNIGIVGNNGTETETRYRGLKIFRTDILGSTLTSPTNGKDDVTSTSLFTWVKDANAESYKIEVAADAAFTNIVRTQINIIDNKVKIFDLTANTKYYWRVIPSNRCVVGANSDAAVWNFTVGNPVCGSNFVATNFANSFIASTPDALAYVPFTVSGGIKIWDINVTLNISHTYTQDIIVNLVGPASIGSPEIPLLVNTCTEFDDINAIFDDSGSAIVCSTIAPAISGTIKPVGELSDLNGLLADGEWRIRVDDPYNGDGGSIVSAQLSFCKVLPAVLSTKDFDFTNLRVYPNPTTSDLNLAFDSKSDDLIEIVIHDIHGRIVSSNNFEGKTGLVNHNVNISLLPQGFYFLKLKQGGLENTTKIIKQ